MDNYQDIIDIIKSTPAVEPPDDFTLRVMSRLQAPQGIWSQIRHVVLNPLTGISNSRWAGTLAVSHTRECSFYFFLTGFFYTIMGFLLLAWFRTIGSNASTMGWLGLQPHLTLGTAILLLALGLFILMDGETALLIARYGTLLYVSSVVMNGMFIRPYFHIPYFFAPHADVFIIGLTAGGVCMGILLLLAVHKRELKID